MNVTRYTRPTHIGPFAIEPAPGGRWQITFGGESLGRYASPRQALDDLCGGHCDTAGSIDTSTLGLPDKLSDWHTTASR